MAVTGFTHADVVQLLKIQEEIKDLLRKYAGHTPAIVPAVACVRIAKGLLSVYGDAERKATIEDVIIPVLRGETEQPSKRGRGLILPPGFTLN